MFDYIKGLDVHRLTANEAGQCLLYLHHVCRGKAELERECEQIRERLKGRLAGLKSRAGRK
jgi:hypothetical protein